MCVPDFSKPLVCADRSGSVLKEDVFQLVFPGKVTLGCLSSSLPDSSSSSSRASSLSANPIANPERFFVVIGTPSPGDLSRARDCCRAVYALVILTAIVLIVLCSSTVFSLSSTDLIDGDVSFAPADGVVDNNFVSLFVLLNVLGLAVTLVAAFKRQGWLLTCSSLLGAVGAIAVLMIMFSWWHVIYVSLIAALTGLTLQIRNLTVSDLIPRCSEFELRVRSGALLQPT